MLKEFVVLLGILAVGHAAVTTDVHRNGNVNRYFVYTRDNFHDPKEVLTYDPLTIDESGIELRRDTVIIVHGHEASAFSSLNPTLRNSYIQNYDINVIIVDWSLFARLSYSSAVAAVPTVGVYLGELVTTLVTANRVDLNRLHLIGFGLGAHVVGFAGRRLQGGVARITGLDPVKSQWGASSGRLTATDARYVEVIHTDTDGLFSNGLSDAIGNVDFYPNGGGNQPGCGLSKSCNHNRAWEFFAATLISDHNLVGNGCASATQLNWNRCNGDSLVMGTNEYFKLGSGIYRVNTGRSYPF